MDFGIIGHLLATVGASHMVGRLFTVGANTSAEGVSPPVKIRKPAFSYVNNPERKEAWIHRKKKIEALMIRYVEDVRYFRWQCGDGKVVLLCNMESSHLRNAIRFSQRRRNWDQWALLVAELRVRMKKPVRFKGKANMVALKKKAFADSRVRLDSFQPIQEHSRIVSAVPIKAEDDDLDDEDDELDEDDEFGDDDDLDDEFDDEFDEDLDDEFDEDY